MSRLLKIVGPIMLAATVAAAPKARADELFLDQAQIDGVAAIASFFEACNGPKVRDEVLDYYKVTKKSQGTPSTAVDLQQIMIRGRIAPAAIPPSQCTEAERKRQANLLRRLLGTAPNP